MRDESERTECRTPTSGRDGVTRIPTWKYECVRGAIIQTFKQSSEAEIGFTDLRTRAKAYLSEDDAAALGSWGWHLTTVKLNMEVLGELSRVPKAVPQRLILTL